MEGAAKVLRKTHVAWTFRGRGGGRGGLRRGGARTIWSVRAGEFLVGVDRLLERLALGNPPLHIVEVARMTGYSRQYIAKLVEHGAILSVGLGEQRRIPVQEAERLARQLRLIE